MVNHVKHIWLDLQKKWMITSNLSKTKVSFHDTGKNNFNLNIGVGGDTILFFDSFNDRGKCSWWHSFVHDLLVLFLNNIKLFANSSLHFSMSSSKFWDATIVLPFGCPPDIDALIAFIFDVLLASNYPTGAFLCAAWSYSSEYKLDTYQISIVKWSHACLQVCQSGQLRVKRRRIISWHCVCRIISLF